MTGLKDKITLNFLINLIDPIKDLTSKTLRDTGRRAAIEQSYKWSLEDFEYSSSGIRINRAGRITVNEENLWTTTYNHARPIFCLPVYLECEKHIRANYKEFTVPLALQSFVFRVFHICLSVPVENDERIKKVKNLFIDELNLKPIKGKALVYMTGLTLESDQILINAHTHLRRTQQEDFEEPGRYDVPFAQMMPYSTAVIEITQELAGRNVMPLAQSVEQLIVLFKLFCLGSVQLKEYKFKIDHIAALPGAGGNVFSGGNHVWQNYYLGKNVEHSWVHSLNNFKLPLNFTSIEKKPDHKTTAFDRYNEASSEKVAFERRVSNAIMGIEALLSNDPKELAFKLSTRTSRLLSYFGYDAKAAREHLTRAYGIRSTFAHGGYLSEKDLDKLRERFRSCENLALTIINYLRILLIISIYLSNTPKNKIIGMIDDALIDEVSSAELSGLVSPVAEFIF